MKLAYTPLDIDFELPERSVVENWFNKNTIQEGTHWSIQDRYHEWALAACRVQPENWRSLAVYENWKKAPFINIKNAGLYFAPGFEETFPGLVKFLKESPFEQIGAAGFLKQLGPIELHRDTYDPTQPEEPRRYLVYITEPANNTFYLKDGVDGYEYNIKIHPKYRAFAFNNTDVLHGAREPIDNKILFSVIGTLNLDAHRKLIERSSSRFSDWCCKIK